MRSQCLSGETASAKRMPLEPPQGPVARLEQLDEMRRRVLISEGEYASLRATVVDQMRGSS